MLGLLLALGCGEERSCEETLTCEPSESARDGGDPGPAPDGDGDPVAAGGSAGDGMGGTGALEPGEPGEPSVSPAGGSAGVSEPSSVGASGGMPAMDSGSAGAMGAEGGVGGADDGIRVPVRVERCDDSTECPEATPVCDPELGSCVVCLLEDDSGCGGDTPLCVGSGNDASRCVECEADGECGVEAPVCSENACQGCSSGDDCQRFEDTPLCREDGQCVGCIEAEDCSVEAPLCTDDGECIGCGDDDDCAPWPGTPVCEGSTGACVGCVEHSDCDDPTMAYCNEGACEGCRGPEDCERFDGLPACSGSTGACVECLTNEDCTSPEASTCEENVCVGCSADSGCSHLPGATTCDSDSDPPMCVECTGIKDDACNFEGLEYVCDTFTRTCPPRVPENRVGSKGVCEPCISDWQCEADHWCIETDSNGFSMGWQCMRKVPQGGCVTVLPFQTGTTTRTIFGAALSFCKLSATSPSTCPAYLDMTLPKPCTSDGDCGVSGFDDGRCDPSGYCQMTCDIDMSCPVGSSCQNGACTL